MVPWNAVPWDTVAIIIGFALIFPSALSILYIKRRRFEELGMVIGVFLLLLSTISYAFIIPTEIINKTHMPEDYLWEDYGDIYYWERNSVFPHRENSAITLFDFERLASKRPPIEMNFTGKEVIHAVEYYDETDELLIHDAIYDEQDELFQVINKQETISEWYTINPSLKNLEYTSVEAGRMGIPMQYDANHIQIGWVESNGEPNGTENVVFVRTMQQIESGKLDGVDVVVWQSDLYNKKIQWHGEEYICDETLRLTVNPQTGYIVHVYRHLVLSARMSQFLQLYYPDYYEKRSMQTLLKISDPVGEAAELQYDSTDASVEKHLANVRDLQAQMTIIPLLVCIPLFLIGLALTWRYCGRSYYWKRYKHYETNGEFLAQTVYQPSSSRKKWIALSLVFILIISSVLSGFLLGVFDTESTISTDHDDPFFIEEPDPTPPGSTRVIDSGRHALEPVDEGEHKGSRREWWYFNVFFTDPESDLQNWSMIISFNKMALNDLRFVRRDNFFTILYDPDGNSYDFGMLNQKRGSLTMGSPGVDITFGNSYAQGQYPMWEVHSENTAEQFTADLTFEADFMPVWVMGKSSNLIIFRYFGGDYYIPRCVVNGTIIWEGKEYHVKGIGYHDHVWQTTVPRWVTKGWEWYNIHFDNGWEMYLSKFILRTPRDLYAAALIISPDNQNIIEYKIFSVEVTEEASPPGLPLMTYPKQYHVYAKRDDMILELDLNIPDPHEIVWRFARTGMFEGPCTATGSFSWEGHTVELNGFGMAEITRVKYLLELPGILPRREPLINRFINR